MGPTQLEVLELKVQRGEALTLDERVYWHEAKQMGVHYGKYEPVITNAKAILSLLSRRGVEHTEVELTEWLNKHGVPL